MSRVLFTCSSGGLGHATRSLSIAKYLRDINDEVEILFAGDGLGMDFVEMNNFQSKRIPQPNFFSETGPEENLFELSKPFIENNRQYRALFEEFDPEVHFCDMELFSLFLGKFYDVYNILLSHEYRPFDFDLKILNRFLRREVIKRKDMISERTFYPLAYDTNGYNPEGEVVGPLAYEESAKNFSEFEKNVLIIPSGASGMSLEKIEQIASERPETGFYIRGKDEAELKNRSSNIKFVEKVPNLYPWINGADVLVCSGYSSIMEAVVANTPCLIIPQTDEQIEVAELCRESGIAAVSDDLIQLIDLIDREEKLKSLKQQESKLDNGSPEIARFIDSKLGELSK